MSAILFVCRYNRFRSIIAEAFFNKYNKNKNHVAQSAGLIKGSPLSDTVTTIAKEYQLKVKKAPEAISQKLLDWQDLLIIVADDVPAELFKKELKPGKKIIVWEVQDARGHELNDVKEIARDIEKKVLKLLKELNAP